METFILFLFMAYQNSVFKSSFEKQKDILPAFIKNGWNSKYPTQRKNNKFGLYAI